MSKDHDLVRGFESICLHGERPCETHFFRSTGLDLSDVMGEMPAACLVLGCYDDACDQRCT